MTVFWDWNGTLVADVPHVVAVNNLIFNRYGYADSCITDEDYRARFRFPVKEYYLELGISEEDFPLIAREWNKAYVAGFDCVPLSPFAAETVRRFHEAGFRQVILSASQVDQLRDQVKRFKELDGMFDEVLGLNNVYAASKVQLARDYLARNDLDPQNAVFLGDSTHDAEVAQAIGCRCFLISGGHQCDSVLRTAKSAEIMPSLQAVADRLLA